jgi:hypothetical protein
VFDAAGKAHIPSAVVPMAQVPQYATSTTVQPTLGGFQMLWFKHPIQVHRQAYCRCSRRPLL